MPRVDAAERLLNEFVGVKMFATQRLYSQNRRFLGIRSDRGRAIVNKLAILVVRRYIQRGSDEL